MKEKSDAGLKGVEAKKRLRVFNGGRGEIRDSFSAGRGMA